MPRFVVLRHDAPRGLHWDFMLEIGPVLATWALDREPGSGGPISATALPGHRVAYLDYEGDVSGGRGTVVRWDRGSYTLETYGDAEVIALVAGEKLRGRVAVRRSTADRWEFSFVATEAPGGVTESGGRGI